MCAYQYINLFLYTYFSGWRTKMYFVEKEKLYNEIHEKLHRCFYSDIKFCILVFRDKEVFDPCPEYIFCHSNYLKYKSVPPHLPRTSICFLTYFFLSFLTHFGLGWKNPCVLFLENENLLRIFKIYLFSFYSDIVNQYQKKDSSTIERWYCKVSGKNRSPV